MTIFFRLLTHDDKATALAEAIGTLRDGSANIDIYTVDLASFSRIPGTPFAYWVSKKILDLFQTMQPLKYGKRDARSGGSTKDDPRFLRAYWEIPSDQSAQDRISTLKGRRWVTFEKGGSVSSFYRDWELVIDWKNDGQCVKQFVSDYRGSRGWGYDWSGDIKGHSFYFRLGLTWSRRADGLSFRVLQAGCIFADKGPGIFIDDNNPGELLTLCGILNSQPFNALVKLQLGRVSLAQSYEVGLIQRTPIPNPSSVEARQLAYFALECINLKRGHAGFQETGHFFWLPGLLQIAGEDISTRSTLWQVYTLEVKTKLSSLQHKLDDIVFHLYGISEDDRQAIEENIQQSNSIRQEILEDAEESEINEDKFDSETTNSINHISLVTDLLCYCVGVAAGRWDLRCATGEHTRPDLPDPFAPLPTYSPGMLQPDEEGRPITTYKVRNSPFTTRPILVDDPGHPTDIVTAVREVLAIIFAGQADAIYQEIVDVLVGSGHDLRPWLRTAFFDEHIKRYSKSRRKAPIYWCLSTPSRRYTIWLYYHRLHRDTLYTVLNDYVAPKLEHETRQLAQLRAEGGENPNATQRKAIENQADFVAELQTFRDEVRQVAPLWQPDLNDGVLINFAPLWRLTPAPRRWQQECQQTWDALRRGDYDWAHLALHLWPARIIPQCQTDRSLAIVHNLDTVFWDEAATGKAQPRPVEPTTVQALIAERSSAAVAAALAALQEAPIAAAAKATKHAAPAKPKRNARPRQAQAFQQAGLALDEDER